MGRQIVLSIVILMVIGSHITLTKIKLTNDNAAATLACLSTQHSHTFMISRGLCDIVEKITNQMILPKGEIKCSSACKSNQFLQLAYI